MSIIILCPMNRIVCINSKYVMLLNRKHLQQDDRTNVAFSLTSSTAVDCGWWRSHVVDGVRRRATAVDGRRLRSTAVDDVSDWLIYCVKVLRVLSGSAEASLRWSGQINHNLTACCIGNIPAKNCRYRWCTSKL